MILWKSYLWISLHVFKLYFLQISLMAQRLKHLPPMQETWVQSLGREDPLEKEMATHSSILAWRIPWTEEPCRLQCTGSQRVRHDWVTSPYDDSRSSLLIISGTMDVESCQNIFLYLVRWSYNFYVQLVMRWSYWLNCWLTHPCLL